MFNQETTMTSIDKVLYTGQTHTIGGRDGAARSSDGKLDIRPVTVDWLIQSPDDEID